MNDDLISRSALKKALEVTQYNDIDDLTRTERLIDNAPPALHDREELIREKLEDITIVKQDGKYRPVKNTSSQECYRVIYEINRLLEER